MNGKDVPSAGVQLEDECTEKITDDDADVQRGFDRRDGLNVLFFART